MKTGSKHTTMEASTIDLVPPVKPKGPLSAYNIFLLVTRRRVLNDNTLTLQITVEIEPQEIEAVLQERSSQKGKRAHRKTHGKISFRALSRLIATHWKTVHPASLRLLKIHEKRETANFKSKMKEYQLASEAYQAASQEVESDTRPPIDESAASKDMIISSNHQVSGVSSSSSFIGSAQLLLESSHMLGPPNNNNFVSRAHPNLNLLLSSNSLLDDRYPDGIAINNVLSAVELSPLHESTMNTLFKILTRVGTSSSDLLEPLDGRTMNGLFAQ